MSEPVLNWTREGQGPVIVLSHALGCDLSMWDGVAEQLKSRPCKTPASRMNAGDLG